MAADAFEVRVSPRIKRDVRNAPAHVLRGLEHALEEMARDPFRQRPGFDCRLIGGSPRTYRLRIGTWRILYVVDPRQRVVTVTTAGPRSTAYRG